VVGFDPLVAALASALFYGVSTYLGGQAAVQISVARSVGLFQVTAFALVVSLLVLTAQSDDLLRLGQVDWRLACASGICFAVGWAFLGHGLARGHTTVVTPVECITSVTFCAIGEGLMVGWPSPVLVGGIALAGSAAALIGLGGRELVRYTMPVGQSVRFGMLAGIAFGLSYMTIGFVSAPTALCSLVVMRLFAASGSLAWLAVESASPAGKPGALAIVSPTLTKGRMYAFAGGILDGFGGLAFVVATVNGLVGISVAVMSLYAAVTVLLALTFRNESLSFVQIVGLVGAAGAIVILSR